VVNADATVPEAAGSIFGARLPAAVHFTELLAEHGVERGLIGPKEVERLWDRHVLNSAVVAELLPPECRVVDVGSGAGLPGIPLMLARPDIDVVLLEPMARRVAWLEEVSELLDLKLTVVRGRAEERSVRDRLGGHDVVTARAVAPLARLAEWCLPLLREGGRLLALKGAGAKDELARDAAAIANAGGCRPEIVSCGSELLDVPTTVVVIERVTTPRGRDGGRRRRKDR
jgi:16S rRNA (guanine527-N7)-methyltransferase